MNKYKLSFKREKIINLNKKVEICIPQKYHVKMSRALWYYGSLLSFNVHNISSENQKNEKLFLDITDKAEKTDVRILWSGISQDILCDSKRRFCPF